MRASTPPARPAATGLRRLALTSALTFAPTFALAAATSIVGAAEAPASSPGAAPSNGDWNFAAALDGKPIGRHRFKVTGSGSERTVKSEADFKVTFMGITAYRYTHRDTEEWRGDCVSTLSATTDDDGKASSVQVKPHAAEALTIQTARGSESVEGCLMSFAYWNPRIEQQTRLLNAQTGKVEQVSVSRAATGTVEVRGQAVNATRWRITGPAQPIDLWYSEHGDWVGLDSVVAGGRKLSYRLD